MGAQAFVRLLSPEARHSLDLAYEDVAEMLQAAAAEQDGGVLEVECGVVVRGREPLRDVQGPIVAGVLGDY